MRSCVLTTFVLTVLPGLLLAQQPGISKDTNFYSGTPELKARVARFTAQPATSKAGQPVRLEWVVENPIGVSIEPEIGAVLARGSKEVTPRQTTTYVLMVHGPRDQMLTREVTVTIPGTAPLKTATPVKREIPKMRDGKANLSGVSERTCNGWKKSSARTIGIIRACSRSEWRRTGNRNPIVMLRINVAINSGNENRHDYKVRQKLLPGGPHQQPTLGGRVQDTCALDLYFCAGFVHRE